VWKGGTCLTSALYAAVYQVCSRLPLSHNNTLRHGRHLMGTYTGVEINRSFHERLSLYYLALGLAELCSGVGVITKGRYLHNPGFLHGSPEYLGTAAPKWLDRTGAVWQHLHNRNW